ncbi:hypothetical protein SAMN06265371_106100 [Lutibacter agarilyticus]|uniref:Uncharacterized protein n=1 Tax=Lutibacter agarilyticus TaxID=1109740 RepID=A0A238XJR9_9FLAO|nr:hypothetical protein [Lutibacter agarilyticus]SNR58960.1 hypothetical protein SAMN06265371_106100 [Lutibacter agarilyticus]
MKLLNFLVLLIVVLTISCKEEKTKVVNSKNTVKKVQHYICENKCENSGGDAAGNCPVCKNPYTHNTAYHANDLLKSGPLKVESNATNPTQKTPQAAPKAPTPAQNTKGVYHYTCTNGCAGGSGAADSCKSCGNKLTHNQLYHN